MSSRMAPCYYSDRLLCWCYNLNKGNRQCRRRRGLGAKLQMLSCGLYSTLWTDVDLIRPVLLYFLYLYPRPSISYPKQFFCHQLLYTIQIVHCPHQCDPRHKAAWTLTQTPVSNCCHLFSYFSISITRTSLSSRRPHSENIEIFNSKMTPCSRNILAPIRWSRLLCLQ